MFTNTSAEYWRGDAGLIHTDFANMRDAEESENVRRYHFAGTMHGSGTFPPQSIRVMDGLKGQLPYNAVDYSPLQRALLTNLDNWVRDGVPAPASRHPSLDDGTGVESYTLREKFERLPGVDFPPRVTRAMRLDYGDEAHLGRTTKLPAEQGEEYPAVVSNVDDDGNETGGIRLPSVSVPLATNTGWNLRHPDNGNPDLGNRHHRRSCGLDRPVPQDRERPRSVRRPPRVHRGALRVQRRLRRARQERRPRPRLRGLPARRRHRARGRNGRHPLRLLDERGRKLEVAGHVDCQSLNSLEVTVVCGDRVDTEPVHQSSRD